MLAQVQNDILLFFVCAFAGWLMEVGCKLVQFRRFINRGFLIGPYCPIYGFGAVLVCRLLSRFSGDPLAVFALALLVCATLEYITSYVMEKLFHARWWDYSEKPFNLNGRVCASTLIPFGVMGLMLVYFVQPFCFGLFDRMPPTVRTVLCVVLCTLLLVDVIVSTTVLGKIRSTANLSHADDTESITLAVREHLHENGLLMRRTLSAFPYAKLYNHRLLSRMKEQRRRLRTERKARRQALHAEINAREEKLRQELRRKRNRT